MTERALTAEQARLLLEASLMLVRLGKMPRSIRAGARRGAITPDRAEDFIGFYCKALTEGDPAVDPAQCTIMLRAWINEVRRTLLLEEVEP